MADSRGLMATRKAYMDAVEAGDTELDHKSWYEQQMSQRAKEEQQGFDSVQATEKTKRKS